MEQPDPQVVAAARAGDLAAFGVLVRLYQAPAWRLAFQLLRDEEAASDATQEAFVKAYRYLPAFRGEARFSTWLFSICRNCCLDELRRRRRADRALQRTAPAPDQADHAPGVEVRAALAALTLDLREPVVLIDLFGMSYREAAEILGLPEGTIKSRVHRARAELARALSDPPPKGRRWLSAAPRPFSPVRACA